MSSSSWSILATLLLRTFGAGLCAKIVGTASSLTSRRLLNLLSINLFCRSTLSSKQWGSKWAEQRWGSFCGLSFALPMAFTGHSTTFWSIHPQVVLYEMESKDLSSRTRYYGQQHNNEAFFCRSFYLATPQRSALPAMLKTSTTHWRHKSPS